MWTITGIESGVPYRVEAWPCSLAYETAAITLGLGAWCLLRGELRFHSIDVIRVHGPESLPVTMNHACGSPDPRAVNPAHIEALSAFMGSLVQGDEDTAAALGLLHRVLGARVYADEPPF